MSNIDWQALLKTEDKLIANADRRYRYHNKSFEAMSETIAHKEKMFKIENDGIIQMVELHAAMNTLTKKQYQAITLYFWQGYKQWEIAEIMGCTRKNISIHISKALKKIKDYLSD